MVKTLLGHPKTRIIFSHNIAPLSFYDKRIKVICMQTDWIRDIAHKNQASCSEINGLKLNYKVLVESLSLDHKIMLR